MKSAGEALQLIAENDFRLLVDERTPNDVWIVTAERKHVRMLAANGSYRAALRIPKAMFAAFAETSLIEQGPDTLYRLTADGIARTAKVDESH